MENNITGHSGIRFVPSGEMKVTVSPEQETQISSKEDIKTVLKKKKAIGFDIYDGDILIGFAMLRRFGKGKFFLWDYAVDSRYQNMHYGTDALIKLVAFMHDGYGMTEMTTTYLWGNVHAKHVYEKVGFTETDVIDEPDCHEVNMALFVSCDGTVSDKPAKNKTENEG